MVLKPSEMAGSSERLIAEIVAEAFKENEVLIVTGGVETAETLLDESFDFIFYREHPGGAKRVAMQAAQSLTPVLLELGGKCPCVVDEGLDLQVVARRILAGKFFNAGQTCFAPTLSLWLQKNGGGLSRLVARFWKKCPGATRWRR